MSQRKLASGVAICSTVLVLSSGQVKADSVDIQAYVDGAPAPSQLVTVHYTSAVLGNVDTGAYAGLINWDRAQIISGSSSLFGDLPSSFASSGTFSTYCIDIAQDIAVNGGPYDYSGLTTSLADTPVVSAAGYTGMGSTAATDIANLYANEYAAVSGSGAIQYDSASDTDSNAGDKAAAFQIAIWQIIYGTSGLSVADSTNVFYVSSYGGMDTTEFNEITGMADRFVAEAGTATGTLNGTLLALTDSTLQDQLIVGNSASPAATVPMPKAAVAGLVLMSGLAVKQRLRRVQ